VWQDDEAEEPKQRRGSDEQGDPSLLDQEKMAEERVRADVLADPNVRAVLDAFPDAELESFSVRGS
jgi:DNA polymerase-3 subunit gamma/tau